MFHTTVTSGFLSKRKGDVKQIDSQDKVIWKSI